MHAYSKALQKALNCLSKTSTDMPERVSNTSATEHVASSRIEKTNHANKEAVLKVSGIREGGAHLCKPVCGRGVDRTRRRRGIVVFACDKVALRDATDVSVASNTPLESQWQLFYGKSQQNSCQYRDQNSNTRHGPCDQHAKSAEPLRAWEHASTSRQKLTSKSVPGGAMGSTSTTARFSRRSFARVMIWLLRAGMRWCGSCNDLATQQVWLTRACLEPAGA